MTREKLLETAINKLGLMARAHSRIIADLGSTEEIHSGHVAEAIHYWFFWIGYCKTR